MKTRRLFTGLNNSQKIRVIINGVGFHTTVSEALNLPFSDQRSAVSSALCSLGFEQWLPEGMRPTSIGRPYTVYGDNGKVTVDVQVDLI